MQRGLFCRNKQNQAFKQRLIMPGVYFVTGGLGSGKGLAAVGKIREYARNGYPIAGNIDLYLDKLCNDINSKTTYTRIPDRPTVLDLMSLGYANTGYDPYENGLLVLDELATWFNARSWQEKGRKELIDWFVHARKYGWDIIFMVQDIDVLDKQLLGSLMDYHVPMTDLSKINIPVIGGLWRNYNKKGRPLTFPKIHRGVVMYKNLVKADAWTFRARDLYNAYDTKQIFIENYPHGAHCQLSRWHLEGRYTYKPNITMKTYLKAVYALIVGFASDALRIRVDLYKNTPNRSFVVKKGIADLQLMPNIERLKRSGQARLRYMQSSEIYIPI